jgi:hypothetical protein
MVRQGVLMAARLLVIGAVALLTACRPGDPLVIQTIQTGKSLNSDNSIGQHAATFGPKEPMYVSVLTTARGSGTITVRWTFYGRTLHEVTKEVSYNDASATDFRFAAADGFPPGEYRIEVLLDGQPAGERTVRVQ